MWWILEITAGEICGIITGVSTGIVAIVAAVGKVINDKRRQQGNMKCCITGRDLKPKKKKADGTKAKRTRNKEISDTNT